MKHRKPTHHSNLRVPENREQRRKLWSQNFFRDQDLVRAMVAALPLDQRDIIYEVGPGEGIITRELAKAAGQVVAIERDRHLCQQLQQALRERDNVRVVCGDFLEHPIQEPAYKVAANIPFSITTPIVNKLLYGPVPVTAAFLIIQKEAAEKFSGSPVESQYSVLAKPWFTFQILREFARTDFIPVPSVDVVLLGIWQRETPLIAPKDAELYRAFVRYAFSQWKKDLRAGLRGIFSNLQFKILAQNLDFPLDATPTQLSVEQWVGLYEYFREGVPQYKQARVAEFVRSDATPDLAPSGRRSLASGRYRYRPQEQ